MFILRITNYFLNYISIRWLWFCLVIGILMFVLASAADIYIASERGTPLNEEFYTGQLYGLVPGLLIPYLLYLVFLCYPLMKLVFHLSDSIFIDMSGERTLFPLKILPFVKNEPDEEPRYENKKARLKVKDRFPYAVHVQITDRRIYLHGGLMKINKLVSGLVNSGHADTGTLHFAFSDIESVEHKPGTRRRRYRVLLKNQRGFDILLPKNDQSTEIDGDALSEMVSLFKDKAVVGSSTGSATSQ